MIKMKSTFLSLIFLMLVASGSLFAQQDNELLRMLNNQFGHSDTLTSSYSGFVHTNWKQAGIGVNTKRLLFMYNTTVLPVFKNYKADVTMADVAFDNQQYISGGLPELTYEVNYKYDVIMVGYIIRFSHNLYPYVGTGTAVKTDMIKVTDPNVSPDVYTVKGKSETLATGVVGVIYTMPHNITIEGSLQINPLLPFLGVGLRL
jgi:hypothetical protein